MSNLLPRTTARIHDLTDGATWNTTDWRIVADLAHAAHQHAVNEAEFTTAERGYKGHGGDFGAKASRHSPKGFACLSGHSGAIAGGWRVNPEKYTPLYGHADAYREWDRLDAALATCDNQADADAVDYLRHCVRYAMRTKEGKASVSAKTRAMMYEWLADQIGG